MSTPTHVIVGAVIAKLAIEHGIVPDAGYIAYAVGIISANIPDADVLFVRHPTSHRASGSHYPIIWAMFLVICSLLIDITGNTELIGYFSIATAGLLTHFILDVFAMGDGIRWFVPFSKKMIRLLPRAPYIPDDVLEYAKLYLRHPIMILEIIMWTIGVYLLLEG